jgi:hypothetical protein
MAFLDNSGDIILDAVLTDTGRYRLAKGDGSFRVAKFALGDDEINYRLYDKNNASGSAYYDLSILQTPILEAFTDNAAGLKSKLMTISRNNLLYLPVLKLNETNDVTARYIEQSFMVAVDEDTEDAMITTAGATVKGLMKGVTVNESANHIQIDQGLDTNYEISPTNALDADLVETQYIIEIDNRLGNIISPKQNGSTVARASYIDDDNIASYFFSLGSDSSFVSEINNLTNTTGNGQTITGPRGTKLQFSIRSSIDLQTTTFLFDQLGGTTNIAGATGNPQVQFIDTNVRVIGATTGYRIDIPVRFIKV